MKDITDLIGRLFLSFIFLFEAYDSIKYFHTVQETMTNYGITWKQDLLLSGAIMLLLLGGTLLLLGYRSSFGAVLLLVYWIPVTFIAHSFWNAPNEIYREESMQFMKNLAIIGGLLIVLVNGSGRYSMKRLFATSKVPGIRR